MNIIKQIFAFSFLFICMQAIATENVYKWTDEDGIVHYGAKPGQSNAEQITIAPAPAPNQYQQERQNNLQEKQQQRDFDKQYDAQRRQEIQDAQDYQKKVKEVCTQYENNLKLLQETGRRVYTVSPDGEYHYFSDEQRKQEIQDLNRKIERYCIDPS